MRTTIFTSIATLIATIWLAAAAAANTPSTSLSKARLGPSSGAIRSAVTQPVVLPKPGNIGTLPTTPRVDPGRIGGLPNIPTHPPVTGTLPTTPPIDPGRIGGLPNIPTHPPVTGTLPPLQPPPGGINLCQIQPSACNRPPVVGNPPGNNPPANPPGNPPVVGNPPGGTPPGGGNDGGHGHHHYYPYLGFGLGIGAALAAPTVVEYVTQPVYAAPADSQAIYGQPTAPNAPVASPSPIDEFLARLNGLNAAMRQGLITKDEYRSQRQAVLASLDAGQVSRSIGIQQGLRHLKSMAETGLLGGKEYDDKRKEFVLYL